MPDIEKAAAAAIAAGLRINPDVFKIYLVGLQNGYVLAKAEEKETAQ